MSARRAGSSAALYFNPRNRAGFCLVIRSTSACVKPDLSSTPSALELPVPMGRIASAIKRLVSTLVETSLLSVFSWLASVVTVTDSAAAFGSLERTPRYRLLLLAFVLVLSGDPTDPTLWRGGTGRKVVGELSGGVFVRIE